MLWRVDLSKQYERYRREIDAAIERVLLSGRYTLSGEVKSFEDEFARYTGVQHAVAVANGTDALILSMKVLGIEPGDEVITTPFTAIPTVSAIAAAGATPVFADVDPDTYLIDLEKIPPLITEKTRAVMPVHIFGNVVDVEKLKGMLPGELAVIEDACQAHGSTLRGKKAGSLGDLNAFSFYPTKNLGAYGDGGMITTDNGEHAERLRLLRMYGMTDKDHTIIPGINSRLDELQAAILRAKLPHLDTMNESRRRIADKYRSSLGDSFFRHQEIPDGVESNYHVFVTRYRGNREKLISYLDENEIQTNIYYLCPQHLQEAYAPLGYRRGSLPCAERLCGEVIALPLYPEMEDELQARVLQTINRFLEKEGEK